MNTEELELTKKAVQLLNDRNLKELKELLEKFKEGLTGRTQEVFLPGGQAWREDGTIQVEEFYMGEVGNCVRRLLGGEYAS